MDNKYFLFKVKIKISFFSKNFWEIYCLCFIQRLECAINDLLNEEEKICVLIYANDPDNSSKREYSALEKGISRTTYYKILSNACNKLDKVLAPNVNQHSTKEL